MAVFRRRLLWTLVSLVVLLVLGTAGYMILERQAFADSLYMTVITVTAVGYREVWTLTPEGRAFTTVVLLGGISWLGFWFASLTSLIVELDLKDALKKRRITREIQRMTDHVIICGAGRTGRQVAQELEAAECGYVIIERDPARVAALDEYLDDPHVVEGDATHDHTLLDAGLADAKGLITCLSADGDNLYVCLSARELAPNVTIVARAYEEESMEKLYRAGASQVVSPNVSSAIRMASVLLRPSVVSFVDIATRSPGFALRMEQLSVGAKSRVDGLTLAEARIPDQTGLVVIAIRKPGSDGGDFVFNPSAQTRVEAGDEVIVLGGEEQLARLRAFMN